VKKVKIIFERTFLFLTNLVVELDLVERSQELLSSGKVDEAIAILTVAKSGSFVLNLNYNYKDDPKADRIEQSEVLFNLGLCYFAGKSDLPKATEYFNECLKKNSIHSNALFNRHPSSNI
jgi:tetratricopeptide (TPR) repeat protein